MTPYSTDITLSTDYQTIAGYSLTRSYLSIYNQSTTSTEYVLLKFRSNTSDTPVLLAITVPAGETVEFTTMNSRAEFLEGELQAASATGTPTITINEL